MTSRKIWSRENETIIKWMMNEKSRLSHHPQKRTILRKDEFRLAEPLDIQKSRQIAMIDAGICIFS